MAIYEPGDTIENIHKWCVDVYEQLKQPFVAYSGDRTVFEDLRVSLVTAKVPASSAPDFEQVNDDGSGSTGVFGYHFADTEYIFFTVQLPHAYKEGSTIYPHIHFQTTSDVDPADNFGIGLEYQWTDVNEDEAANTTSIEIEISTGVDSLGKHQVADLATSGIDGTDKKISSVLLCRLYRLAAVGDNYADDVIITDFDIHYEKDTHGSREIWTK